MSPDVGALHGFGGLLTSARVRRALVEAHADVNTELALNLDGPLGREEQLAAVEVTLEGDAFIGDLARLAE